MDDILIDVPGLGLVAFPAGTKPDVIQAAIQRQTKQDSQPVSGGFGASNMLGITQGQQRQQGQAMGQALAPWAPVAAGALAGVATGGIGALPAMAGVGAATGAGSMLGDKMAGRDIDMGAAAGQAALGAGTLGLGRGVGAVLRLAKPVTQLSQVDTGLVDQFSKPILREEATKVASPMMQGLKNAAPAVARRAGGPLGGALAWEYLSRYLGGK